MASVRQACHTRSGMGSDLWSRGAPPRWTSIRIPVSPGASGGEGSKDLCVPFALARRAASLWLACAHLNRGPVASADSFRSLPRVMHAPGPAQARGTHARLRRCSTLSTTGTTLTRTSSQWPVWRQRSPSLILAARLTRLGAIQGWPRASGRLEDRYPNRGKADLWMDSLHGDTEAQPAGRQHLRRHGPCRIRMDRASESTMAGHGNQPGTNIPSSDHTVDCKRSNLSLSHTAVARWGTPQ